QLLENSRVFRDQSRKLLAQVVADRLHMLEEAWPQDEIDRRIADGHAERISAIGRAVRSDRHPFGGFRRRQTSAQWKSAANALGDAHDVRCHADPFVGEEFSGAPDAALDLVEDQEQAAL